MFFLGQRAVVEIRISKRSRVGRLGTLRSSKHHYNIKFVFRFGCSMILLMEQNPANQLRLVVYLP